jgi:hypothetical protein
MGSCTKYCYDDQIKKNEKGEACSTHGRDENVYNIYVGKPEENTRKTLA